VGGCPYAKGASGNVATEDVVYMLHGMGVQTGVAMDKLIETSVFVTSVLGCSPQSHLAKARGAN
jgi:hydroxymethylglutaryl-CoA lyase